MAHDSRNALLLFVNSIESVALSCVLGMCAILSYAVFVLVVSYIGVS